MNTESERQEVWKLFVSAVKPLQDQKLRVALALSVLSELMDSPQVPTAPIVEAIEHSEAAVYLHRYPPSGGAC